MVGERVGTEDSDPPPPDSPRNVVTAGAPNRPSRNAESVGKSRCADRLVDVLEGAGIDTVYGVPGGAISPIYDALYDHPNIRVVHARHETSAIFMSIGHTRVRPNSIPCVLVTSGPGVTNSVTGLAAVLGEGVPVVVIGGEVPRAKFGHRALQEGSAETIDVVNIVRTVTRSAACITIPGHAAYQLATAIDRAKTERGPVFLSLPLDVAVAPTPPIQFARTIRPRPTLDQALLNDVADALRNARRPLLLVGSGARGAAYEIRALAEKLRIPVITSPKAKGIVPEMADYCVGVFGYGGHPSATEFVQQNPPDVVLALGCGLTEPSTNSWSSLLQASHTMIQVDIDPSQFGRNYRPDLAIEGDAADVIREIRRRLANCAPWERTLPGIRYLDPHMLEGDRVPLAPARVLRVVQEEMPPTTVYTSDIGEHLLFALHYLQLSYPDQFMASYALGSMGSGICAAIGAKLAAPERSVVAICGDYGFQMYGMDLNMCVQEGLGVVFVVMNDDRMRMVEAGIDRIYGRTLPMHGPRVNFAELARAHGAQGFVAADVDQLRSALRRARNDVPTVIDARIDPTAAFPMNSRVQEISNFASG
ncbi:thiamine pyrophosphate-binding protein [Pendulispora brunnea]|uniref:Thiamine pyrophosphate-binding protein n=1 Tax=Pendulispora brunnea TaxID=2905690 RepID=A0ABZ2KLB3_9BACT